ncbi:MAG: glycosyltransferase family 2 protein [Bacteroidaceae bacterium]|nr:glycosyltransferase family 2 protein [Bacteroidaceae bacterium]
MCLDVLICTIDQGILRVPQVILPPQEGVRWVVSMQYTDGQFLDVVPQELTERKDITLTCIEGKGLCRNRNNAIQHASGDILLVADDDCQYTAEALDTVIKTYELNPSADIILFQSNLEKYFPERPTLYQKAFQDGYYPSSVEMSFRKGLGLRFDERFGLGSEHLSAGEESVFLKDAENAQYSIVCIPKRIVTTPHSYVTDNLLTDKQLQRTKGATFRYLFGTFEAIWRCIRETGYHTIHSHVNPIPLLYNLLRGIWILR